MARLTRKGKIALGTLGVAGVLATLGVILRRRFGFSEPPTPSNWKRSARSGQIRTTRGDIRQLQDAHKRQVERSRAAAENKRQAEIAARNAEWARRKSLYDKARAGIEAAEP